MSLLIHPKAAKANWLASDSSWSVSPSASFKTPLVIDTSTISTSARSLRGNADTAVFKNVKDLSMQASHGSRPIQQIPASTGWNKGIHASLILDLRKEEYQSQAKRRFPERGYGPVTASRKAALSGSRFSVTEAAVWELKLDRVVPLISLEAKPIHVL